MERVPKVARARVEEKEEDAFARERVPKVAFARALARWVV